MAEVTLKTLDRGQDRILRELVSLREHMVAISQAIAQHNADALAIKEVLAEALVRHKLGRDD